MKNILLLTSVVFCFLQATSQVSANRDSSGDSTGNQMARHHWNHQRMDSSRDGHFDHRAMATSRFGSRGGDGFRSLGPNNFRRGIARNHMHYTPQQRVQLKAIGEEYRKKSADLFSQDNLTLREYKSKLIALQKERKGKMEDLLTPAQKLEVQKWKKQFAENIQVRAAANLERMKIRLNLSDEQVAKLKSQQGDLRSQMMAIHQNDELLPYQKREQMKALLAKRQEEIKSVLSPEQFSQFETMHKQRFEGRPERNMMN